MKIAISNTIFFEQKRGGISRYFINLTDEFDKRGLNYKDDFIMDRYDYILKKAKDLFEECVFVTSSAINPTSAYLMINYFNAIPFDENNNPISTPLNDYEKVKEYFVAHDGGLESKTELTEVNVAKAKEVFMGIAKYEIKCKKMEERGGGKKRGEKEKKKKAGRKTRKRKIKKSRKQISKKTNYSSNR